MTENLIDNISKLHANSKDIENNLGNSIKFKTSNSVYFEKEEKCLLNILITRIKPTTNQKFKVGFIIQNKSHSDNNYEPYLTILYIVYVLYYIESDCTSTYIYWVHDQQMIR